MIKIGPNQAKTEGESVPSREKNGCKGPEAIHPYLKCPVHSHLLSLLKTSGKNN